MVPCISMGAVQHHHSHSQQIQPQEACSPELGSSQTHIRSSATDVATAQANRAKPAGQPSGPVSPRPAPDWPGLSAPCSLGAA